METLGVGLRSKGVRRVLLLVSKNGRSRRSYDYTMHVLQSAGVQCFVQTSGGGGKGETKMGILEDVDNGVRMGKRTGCGAVLALGSCTTVNLGKLVAGAMMTLGGGGAGGEIPEQLRDYAHAVTPTQGKYDPPKKSMEKRSDMPILMTVPTVVCGGDEANDGRVDVMNWGAHEHLVFLRDSGVVAPVTDRIIDVDMIKSDQVPVDVDMSCRISCFAKYLNRMLLDPSLCHSEDWVQGLRNITTSLIHRNEMRPAFDASVSLGELDTISMEDPRPAKTIHHIMATAFCNIFPVHYSSVVAGLLDVCCETWESMHGDSIMELNRLGIWGDHKDIVSWTKSVVGSKGIEKNWFKMEAKDGIDEAIESVAEHAENLITEDFQERFSLLDQQGFAELYRKSIFVYK